MQSVTIGLFDQRFVRTGSIDKAFLDAIRQMFELKPKCSGDRVLVTEEEIERYVQCAASFIVAVEGLLAGKT